MPFEVIPFLWGFVCMFTGIWALATELRYKSAEQFGFLSPSKSLYRLVPSILLAHEHMTRATATDQRRCLSASSYVVIIGFVRLSISLAFPPNMDTPSRLILHTIPYQLWTFSLCTLAISQVRLQFYPQSVIRHGYIYVTAFLFLFGTLASLHPVCARHSTVLGASLQGTGNAST